MADLGFDGCAFWGLLWMVSQLGFVFWSLWYSALSLGWPVNSERRGGMAHFGHQDGLDQKLCPRVIYSWQLTPRLLLFLPMLPRLELTALLKSQWTVSSTGDARSHILFTPNYSPIYKNGRKSNRWTIDTELTEGSLQEYFWRINAGHQVEHVETQAWRRFDYKTSETKKSRYVAFEYNIDILLALVTANLALWFPSSPTHMHRSRCKGSPITWLNTTWWRRGAQDMIKSKCKSVSFQLRGLYVNCWRRYRLWAGICYHVGRAQYI